jgi:hypothetical protein
MEKENQIRWRATWVDRLGRERVTIFHGPESLVVARVDFQLKLMAEGEHVPDEFALEEATILHPARPGGLQTEISGQNNGVS